MRGIGGPAIGRDHPRAYIDEQLTVTLPRNVGTARFYGLGEAGVFAATRDVKDAK
jgi:hypothetical protein